jgi:rifamycin polyketide synthase module 1/2/3
MGNAVEAVESYLAVARAGAVGAFLNPAAGKSELAYMLEDSGAELLLVDSARREQIKTDVDVVATDGAFEELAGSAGPTPPDDLDLDAPAWMLYTSGTTGRPKGVLLSQRSCLWVVASCWAPVLDLGPDEELLSALPLFHSYALDLTVVAIVATGASLRLLPRFSPARAIATLREEPVSLFAGVPTMFHYLVEHLDGEPLRAQRLRLCVSAGAILPAALTEAFERATGVPLLDGYGITETSTMVTMNWPTGARPPGSCGLPLPGCAVRLVDPGTGADVEPEEEGELIVRGPQVMLGYHNRPEDTAEALQDGWYHTGDLARADRNGYLTITGRIKELIIRGGENIAPAEVEQAITEHPGVTEAAVVGRPDEALGEAVAAFVVADEGAVQAEDLRGFAAERLADFKVPCEFHFVEEIPRTGSGKVMRHRLAELLD